MKKIKQKIVAAAMLLGVAQFSVAFDLKNVEEIVKNTDHKTQAALLENVNAASVASFQKHPEKLLAKIEQFKDSMGEAKFDELLEFIQKYHNDAGTICNEYHSTYMPAFQGQVDDLTGYGICMAVFSEEAKVLAKEKGHLQSEQDDG